MGMFDELRCRHPKLPAEHQEHLYQTKDTPEQHLDMYEIREDGTLWHETYDIEDRSDPNAEGALRFAGCMTRVDKKWEPCPDFTGEICFYGFARNGRTGWIEYSAYLVNGAVKEINMIQDTKE